MSFGYLFNFSPFGQIVSYDKLTWNGKTERERIDRDENAYQENGFIIIEERDGRDSEWDIFQDADNDGVWQKIAEGQTTALLDATKQSLNNGNSPLPNITLVSGYEDTRFRFDAAGNVTHVGESEGRGMIEYDRVDRDDTFQVNGLYILEKETERGRVDEWHLYHDADNDGIWSEVARGDGDIDFDALLLQINSDGQETGDNDGMPTTPEPETPAQPEPTPPVVTDPTPPVTPSVPIHGGREDTLFRFDASGKVTHTAELEGRGFAKYERIDRDDTFEVRGLFILEQEMERGQVDDWNLYHDADRDGIWAEVASGNGAVDFDALLVQMEASGFAVI